MKTSRPSWSPVLMAVVLVALAFGAILWSGPPAPIGDDAADTVFSAERAMRHVRAIARKPRPMGSAEHARVRDYIVSELQAIGLAVDRQATIGQRVRGGGSRPNGSVVAGSVENLLARLPGTNSTGTVMLACHYDSVAAAPGAADDASAVAAIIETLRALAAGGRLRNSVVAVFTDGEEDGLLGAEAFVSRHAWARDVRVVLNFEARGRGGPVQMFETTPGNGAIVREWAKASPTTSGASLAYEVYKRLPNDSDFTEFRRLDAVGLNFAFIDDVDAYHTPRDAPEALDARSVQAHGNAALNLARRFGSADLDLRTWRGRDAVFFSLPGGYIVTYSVLWAVPLVLGALVLWIFTAARAYRRGDSTVGGLILAAILLAAFLGIEAWGSLKVNGWLIRMQAWWEPYAAPVRNGAYALSLTGFAVFDWLIVYVLMRKKFAAQTLSLAASLIVWMAAAASAVLLPGASYLLMWPLAAALCATMVLPPARGSAQCGPLAAATLMGLAVPTLAIVAPTAFTVFSALLLTTEGAAALTILVLAGLAALLPQLEVVTQGRRWWPALVVLLASLGALAAGGVTAAHGPRHPRAENLVYALDADARTALWATTADPPGPWLSQFVTNEPKRGPLPAFAGLTGAEYASAEAQAADLTGPVAELRSAIAEDGGRLITVRLASPRRARTIVARIPDREVLDARIAGRQLRGPQGALTWGPGRWNLAYVNVPPEGIDVTLRVKGMGPVTFVVADVSEGLPDIPNRTLPGRPDASMPVHRGDITLVQRTLTF